MIETPMHSSLNTVTIEKYDAKEGILLDTWVHHNRLVLRHHVVLTHLLSPVGDASIQNQVSASEFAQIGIPTDEDLKLTKMRFGTDGTETDITMSGVLSIVEPRFNADGSTIPPGEQDFYEIDQYTFKEGAGVGDVRDFAQALEMQATMAGPQGNSTTSEPITYREAGLYTANDILFARVNLPNLVKTSDFAFRFSWTIRFP